MTTVMDPAPVRQNIQPTYGYYRKPDGWITVSPMTESEELKYRREGWEPLVRYGRFDIMLEYAVNNPLEGLFIGNGAHELPLEQVLQTGLYMAPPLVPSCRTLLTQYHPHHLPSCWIGAQRVVFPQLEGLSDYGPYDCRFCGRDLPTTAARDQHESVAHQAEKGEIRTGETLAGALLVGLGGAGTAAQQQMQASPDAVALLSAQLEALQAEIAALKQPRPYVCDTCGRDFTRKIALKGHQRTHS